MQRDLEAQLVLYTRDPALVAALNHARLLSSHLFHPLPHTTIQEQEHLFASAERVRDATFTDADNGLPWWLRPRVVYERVKQLM
ncbi:MAG: hypothetical protein OK454_12160 [Thaumarchaeota archaeon]|nr:hypothetical protein [Nitrososphaerota archaeon]